MPSKTAGNGTKKLCLFAQLTTSSSTTDSYTYKHKNDRALFLSELEIYFLSVSLLVRLDIDD